MTKNDILRRLRYCLQISSGEVAAILTKGGRETTASEVDSWLKRDDEAGFAELADPVLCRFLDALIIEKRGPRPDGMVSEPAAFLSNNEILKKLRIALEMRDEEMNATFERVEFVVTKPELASFFRREGHRNYRKCPEQVLRKFLQGLAKLVEE